MPASDRPRAPAVAVLHLARRANGPDAVRSFLEAYASRDAGVDHELIVIAKGHDSERELDEVLAGARVSRVLPMPDDGFDLTAYLRAAAVVDHDVLVYLNSFSAPLAEGWLARLVDAIAEPGVGLAGATGSWASMVSYLVYQLGLPTAYASAYPDRAAVRDALAAINGHAPARPGPRGWLGHRVGTAAALTQHARDFPRRYPAPHVRTNAFAVQRDVMRGIASGDLETKRRAHALESGRRSITRQVQDMGLAVRVAGADGRSYAPEEWPESATFWQRRQENLLVADNQTRLYEQGDGARRLVLSRYAWADRAQPQSG